MPTDPKDIHYQNGAVVPDDWVPVTVGVEISPRTVVALRIGTGGTSLTADTEWGTARVFANPANGEIIEGRFKEVTAVAGGVADILAAVMIPGRGN